MAIGARSQSARTYLEKHLNTFLDCDLNELVAHGLRALRDTLPNEVDLNNKVTVSIKKKYFNINIFTHAILIDSIFIFFSLVILYLARIMIV